MAIQNTVLYGNGPNMAINPKEGVREDHTHPSWQEMLEWLAPEVGVNLRDFENKPLTLVFDEILLRSTHISTKAKLQNKLALSIATVRNMALDDVISCLSKNVLTTNYAFLHRRGIGFGGYTYKAIADVRENTHSLFRCAIGSKRNLWYLHGCTDVPTSIALGYRQYAKSQTQINDYLSSGVAYAGNKKFRSPLSGTEPNFEFDTSDQAYSWVDLFLRDHIHVVGLGLGYTETTLWWLIVEKFFRQQRFPKNIGGMTCHHIEIKGITTPVHEQHKLNMLEDLGVTINKVVATNYFDGYLDVADCIRPGIKKLYENNDEKKMVR